MILEAPAVEGGDMYVARARVWQPSWAGLEPHNTVDQVIESLLRCYSEKVLFVEVAKADQAPPPKHFLNKTPNIPLLE